MSPREIVKRLIPNAIMSMYRERNFIREIKNYHSGQRYISRKNGDGHSLKIVFIMQYPEMWSSMRTVYEAAIKKDVEALILCIPKLKAGNFGDYDEINEAKQFFDSIGLPAIDAYCRCNSTWFDLESYEPDYAIYNRPYNEQYPNEYNSNTVCRYANVCYIPYGFELCNGKMFRTAYRLSFMLSTHITFAPSRELQEDLEERFAVQKILKTHKYIYLGFPRFDLLANDGINIKTGDMYCKTIAWFPRWTVGNCSAGQKGSHFFDYIEDIMKYMEKHSDSKLIIRPHPLMFKEVVNKGIMSQEEIDSLKTKIKNADNVCIDDNKDYLPTIFASDILVADFTSLLAEYFVTGKPIIYCDTTEDFNSDAKMIYDTCYHAADWNDVENCLDELTDGRDVKRMDRQKAIVQLMPSNAGHIGEDILDYIISDFNK